MGLMWLPAAQGAPGLASLLDGNQLYLLESLQKRMGATALSPSKIHAGSLAECSAANY